MSMADKYFFKKYFVLQRLWNLHLPSLFSPTCFKPLFLSLHVHWFMGFVPKTSVKLCSEGVIIVIGHWLFKEHSCYFGWWDHLSDWHPLWEQKLGVIYQTLFRPLTRIGFTFYRSAILQHGIRSLQRVLHLVLYWIIKTMLPWSIISKYWETCKQSTGCLRYWKNMLGCVGNCSFLFHFI